MTKCYRKLIYHSNFCIYANSTNILTESTQNQPVSLDLKLGNYRNGRPAFIFGSPQTATMLHCDMKVHIICKWPCYVSLHKISLIYSSCLIVSCICFLHMDMIYGHIISWAPYYIDNGKALILSILSTLYLTNQFIGLYFSQSLVFSSLSR